LKGITSRICNILSKLFELFEFGLGKGYTGAHLLSKGSSAEAYRGRYHLQQNVAQFRAPEISLSRSSLSHQAC